MKTVLVTGGNGFIGGYVTDELLARGYDVTVLDTRARPSSGVVVLGDIRDPVAVGEAVSHADGVIHLAGLLGTAEMVAYPKPAVEVNILGALNVFEAAATHDVPVVNIAIGSQGATNTYAITKDTADQFGRMFVRYRGAAITTVRAYDAYGPRQVPPAPFGPSRVRKIIPSFACRALSGLPIEVYGDGEQVIDLIHVADVATVLADALEMTARSGPVAEVIEAGSGRPVTVLGVAEHVLAEVGGGEITHLPMRPGESHGAIIVATEPYMAVRSLSVGLPGTIAYYRGLLA
ncbi:MAG: NAD-dependent epimerase/dehydratase family protein [Acidimicrobiales bacterium]